MKTVNRIGLGNLRRISQEEFDKAGRICEEIQQIVKSRDSYVSERNLNPDIALPAATWGQDGPFSFRKLYELVSRAEFDVINRLKLYTQPFTGFQLASFSYGGREKSYVPYPLPDDFDERFKKLAPSPDIWVTRHNIISHRVPAEYRANPPRIMGEIGWDIDGVLVNHDTYVYQERLNLLYEEGIIGWLRKQVKTVPPNVGVTVLEIGGGYGGLAYHIKKIIPSVNYIICDLPESLLFSAIYLTIAHPEYPYTIYDGKDKRSLHGNSSGFKFIPNFMFDDLLEENIKVDLVINTASLSEMTEQQVRYYGKTVSSLIGNEGVFFEQNQDPRHIGLPYPKVYLSEYFKFCKTCKTKSVPGLIMGAANVWTNRRINEILGENSKRPPVTRHRRSAWWRWWFASKIRSLVLRVARIVCKIIGRKQYSRLVQFLVSSRLSKIIDNFYRD